MPTSPGSWREEDYSPYLDVWDLRLLWILVFGSWIFHLEMIHIWRSPADGAIIGNVF